MKIVDVIKVLSDANIYVFLEEGKLKTRSRENTLTADLIELIKNNKQELLDYLSRHENTILFNEGVITPYDGTEVVLSFSQQRYWLMDQIESNIGQRNLLFALKLSGELDLNVLDRVFSSLVDRHHVLRTQFLCNEKDNPIQLIREEYDFAVVKKDFSKLAIADRERAIAQVIDEEHTRRFDLNTDLMLRVKLLHIESKQYILIVTIHHIAADGWSVGILIDEFARLYEAYKLSLENPLVPLGIKYADYAHWQHKQVNERKAGALDFWRGELLGAPEKISLPADYISRSAELSVAGISRVTIERTLIDQFKNKLFASKGTLFAGLFASLNVLFYRWCAQQDLVVGVVDAGRDRKEVERVVGCFVNALAIRTKIPAFESLGDLLENVCAHLLDVAEHKFFPFEKVVAELNPDRVDSTNPFFNVALLLQNFADSSWDIKDLHVDVLPTLKSKAFLDLRFVAWETEQGLIVECEYREELFSARTIDALLDSYRMVVEQFVNCEQRTIDAVEISNDLFLQAQSINYRKKTICAVGTFTLDPLIDSFEFLQKKLSLHASLDLLPFQQVFQQLLDSNSEFRKNKNGFNIILLGLHDWLGVGDFIQQGKNLHDGVHRFCSALDEVQRISSVPYIVMLCPSSAQICGSDQLFSTVDALHKKIAEQFSGSSKVKVVMPAELVDGVDDCFDYETYRLAHIPYTPIFYSALMSRALRAFNAADSKPYKVIVLDCDNTIWKGVCAEDGPLGVVVSAEYLYLQKFVVELQEKGFLLCLCSKNEEGDVWAVFDENNNMHIKREHIIASRINWEPKWKNIYSIADELNLGLESIIFIDDDLSQCLEMRMHCPDVLTIQLPAAVDKIPKALRNIWAFDVEQAALAGNRTALYEQQNKRKQFLIEHKGSRQDFLESLGVNIDVKTLSADNCDRAVELLARTNQFNLNGYLVNKSDLLEGLDNYIFGVTARVEDRFGDYGLVGLVLFTYKNNNLSVLNMVLSCRALGRGVEYELLKAVAAVAFERNITGIEWSFVPSARNTPVFNFLSQLYGAIAHAEPASLIPNRKSYCCLQAESILNLNYLDILEREDSAQQLPALESHAGSDGSLNVLPGRWLSSAQYNQIFIWMNDFDLFHQSVEDWARDSIASQRVSEQQNYVAPVTNIEKRLCELWGDILGVESIGVTDNFFKMGGNSLLATRLIANINRSFDMNLQLNLLFSAQTISALAVLIENNQIIARMALDKEAALLPNEVELSI